MIARVWLATPSSSKGEEPRPRGLCGSSVMVTAFENTCWPSLSLRKETPRATELMEKPEARWNPEKPPLVTSRQELAAHDAELESDKLTPGTARAACSEA